MNEAATLIGGDATVSTVLRSASLEAKTVPSRVVLAPWGDVQSSNGSFVFDAEAGRLVMGAFAEQKNDLPIDYEHQTLGGAYASPSGKAPAAGWIQSLEVVAGEGLVAHVEWTPEAREHLSSKEYRFLSPVAIVRRSDRRMTALHSAALTNKPAIVQMTPIVNSASVDVTDGGEAALDAALEELKALRATLAQRDADDRVAMAMSAGKLSEAQRAWASDFARRLPAEFDAWAETAPVLVACGRTSPPTDTGATRSRGVEHRARDEYRASPFLQQLTSEEAYVADALRARS